MMKRGSSNAKDESYEHVLMCLICRSLFDDYDHQPKFLPCHHTFCKDCLREYCRQIGDEIECPSCRKIANIPAAGVAALQTNFYVKYIQSLVSGSGGQNSYPLECSKHPQEKLQFFCESCEKSLCKECCKESVDTCEHQRVAITKVIEESHQKLDTSFCQANATIEERKVKIEKALRALASEKDNALLKIESTFEQHVHTLNRRATLLKNKVIDIYNENVERLENDLLEISTALTCIVSLKDYHEDKISHGDYREFAKGIEDIEEVNKNIEDRIHPVETHILFEGNHGTDKYRVAAKDIGRVKFTRVLQMPRTEPEGNDASEANSAGTSGPVTSQKGIRGSSSPPTPDTPNTPTVTEDVTDQMNTPLQSPTTENSPYDTGGACPEGAGHCEYDGSTAADLNDNNNCNNVTKDKTEVKDETDHKSNGSEKHNLGFKDCYSNNYTNNNTKGSSEKNPGSVQVPDQGERKDKNEASDDQHSPSVMTHDNTGKTQRLKENIQKKTNIATITPSNSGRCRPRNLLCSYSPATHSANVERSQKTSQSPPQTRGNCGSNDEKSNKKQMSTEASTSSAGPSALPTRFPAAPGSCKIPQRRSKPSALDQRKLSMGTGLSRRSPPGQRIPPNGGQCRPTHLPGVGRSKGPVANSPRLTANGNIMVKSNPETATHVSDAEKLRAEKEYYHLLYTSYDEEELLKELKSGTAKVEDTDSWMTTSSGDESNSTNCSDEILADAEQTAF